MAGWWVATKHEQLKLAGAATGYLFQVWKAILSSNYLVPHFQHKLSYPFCPYTGAHGGTGLIATQKTGYSQIRQHYIQKLECMLAYAFQRCGLQTKFFDTWNSFCFVAISILNLFFS